MNAVPLPALMVTEVEAVYARVALPNRVLQGAATEQFAPIVRSVADTRLTARSASWLADCAPAPASTVHVFAAVHPKTFVPAVALER